MQSALPLSATLRRAVIDVGTNSVKLLVADVTGRSVVPLHERSHQTRLGAGFYETHWLQRDAIERTASAVAQCADEAARWQAQSIRVIATSAARDARNQSELQSAIQQASGLAVEIISGEQEADWVFAGVTSDPALASHPLLILDVGGGSTEFILGDGPAQIFRRSFPLGTVRLLERIRPSDPPLESEWSACHAQLQQFLKLEIRPHLDEPRKQCAGHALQLVTTGGTSSILAAMQLELPAFDRVRIEALRLTRKDVWQRQRHLWGLPLAQRKTLAGLPPNRADVILMGVAILAMVMEEFGFEAMRVSTRGLRFAAMMDLG
ncbi:MAG: Ppx/GppA family phosphatase [Verrucomicrobia bacterium]|nr:Ppx/GppA family phosphatase [Verrucomicrobiota bacterium]